MKSIMQYGFTLVLIIAVAVALYASRNWNATTALFPEAVGVPMLVLLIVVLVMDIRKGRRRKEKKETDSERRFSAETGLTLLYLAWLAGFVALAWALGLLYSIPIYVFIYMKLQGRIGWFQCGVYAVAATAFVYIFGYMFQMAWPEGALLSVL